MTFDTRNALLNEEISEDWDPHIQEQWRTNQRDIREGLLAEFGTLNGEDKIANYQVMGSAPWSIVFEHNVLLAQVRSAFAHGDFYPALVGACALGERVFNQLIATLRDDYVNHPATTRRVRAGATFSDWGSPIDVLHGWSVLTDELRRPFYELGDHRHASVHFDPRTKAEQRDPALHALQLIQQIIEGIFAPHGGPPTFIDGSPGTFFIARQAEEIPLIKRVFLPRCALVSPAHRLYPNVTRMGMMWIVVDDADYEATPLTDEEFVQALPSGTAAMHPEFRSSPPDAAA